MNTVIENNFFELQKKTTHVIVEQRVILSEQEQIDTFLDRINETKKTHIALIPEYRDVIEMVVEFISEDRSVDALISISESIHGLLSTTKRLIKTFSEGRLKNCYQQEIKEYKILQDDLSEVHSDILSRINGDKEMLDLLASI